MDRLLTAEEIRALEHETSGPWFVEPIFQSIVAGPNGECLVADSQYVGDGQLIAAAPDLKATALHYIERDKRRCIWTLEEENYNVWNTQCGEAFEITDGTPSENSMKHCCYCGGHIDEEIITEDDEDD